MLLAISIIYKFAYGGIQSSIIWFVDLKLHYNIKTTLN